MNTIQERVAAGAAWLDGRKPGWFRSINTESLEMSSGRTCVIGQVFGNYFNVVGERIFYLERSFYFEPSFESVFSRFDALETRSRPMYVASSKIKTEEWAIEHGFQKRYSNDCEYDALAAEWKRVIESRLLEEKYREGMPSVSPVQNVIPRERVLVAHSVRPEPVSSEIAELGGSTRKRESHLWKTEQCL